MAVDWGYFDKYEKADDKYLPFMGEGETMATQICTAVTKLIYKWYNDGDVFDNTYHLNGWANDLSSYANWLVEYANAGRIMVGIEECRSGDDYEDLLKDLADKYLDMDFLDKANEHPKQGSIYDCDGRFKFDDSFYDDEDDDEWW